MSRQVEEQRMLQEMDESLMERAYETVDAERVISLMAKLKAKHGYKDIWMQVHPNWSGSVVIMHDWGAETLFGWRDEAGLIKGLQEWEEK